MRVSAVSAVCFRSAKPPAFRNLLFVLMGIVKPIGKGLKNLVALCWGEQRTGGQSSFVLPQVSSLSSWPKTQ